jgi:hypothetical protein
VVIVVTSTPTACRSMPGIPSIANPDRFAIRPRGEA